MTQIWQRYFLREMVKVLLLFLCAFYLLYVLIDYSAHAKSFHQYGLSFFKILLYYLLQFSKRAEILLSLALMISTIKVLCSANVRGEWIALTTGGIGIKRLLIPFLLPAMFCTLFCYMNAQFLVPKSLTWIEHFENIYFKSKKGETYEVKQLLLDDNTCLIYQSYDPEKRVFFDVFWIKSMDEFYKIKFLDPYATPIQGKWVEHILRDTNGILNKQEDFHSFSFSEMKLAKKKIDQAITPIKTQPISELAKTLNVQNLLFKVKKMTNREARAATYFYYKLMMPLACFFAVLGPAPFALRITRNLPIFWIYTLSFVGLIVFFTLMSASIICGESQTLPPLIALLLPPLIYSLGISYRFIKL